MTFAQFFSDYWWLMFPVFGMVMAFRGAATGEQRARSALEAIKAYVDQGKEPPPELMKIAASGGDDFAGLAKGPGAASDSRGWTFIVFAALAAGFGTGYYFVRGEDYAFAFLIVAVTMGVMALGALVLMFTGRRG